MDWCAHFDGEEELGNYGWGETRLKAIQDLISEYGDEEEWENWNKGAYSEC